jgi:AmmeMemoRadiSam system protein A
MPIPDPDRIRLLAFARHVLEARVRRAPPPPRPDGGVFELPRGAFVSIHCGADLRGCLGRLEPDPLGATVAHLAAVVADSDPRFDAVRADELSALVIELSVLTPEQEIGDPGEVEVGRHGLIVEKGYRRGLLLPQVPVEHGWDREEFLAHTCSKAGLPCDAWRQGARLFVFEAEVFGERPSLRQS